MALGGWFTCGLRSGFAILLLSAAVAGCLSAQIGSDGPLPGSDPVAVAFLEPRIIATYDNSQREAFLAVSPDGRVVLTCAHGNFDRPSFMFASVDSGNSFFELDGGVPGVAGDCDVAASQESWAFLHSTVAGATIASTQDEGSSWMVNPVTAIPVNGLADRPWIEYHGESLLLSFMPLTLQPGTIGFTRSEDHGRTWSVPEWLVPPDPERPNVLQGRFLIDEAGTIRVPFAQSMAAGAVVGVVPTRFGFATSTGGGESWEYRHAFDAVASLENPVGVSVAGRLLHWAYGMSTGDGNQDDLFVRSSADGGATWSEPVKVGEDMRWSRPWAVGHSEGYADILWQERGDGEDVALWRVDRVHANGTVERLGHDLVPQYSRDFAEFSELARWPDGRLLASIPDLRDGAGVIHLVESG